MRPRGGEYRRETRWRTGQIYREPVRLQLPKSIAPGNYDVIVKMYRLSDGEVLGAPVPLVRVQIVSQ